MTFRTHLTQSISTFDTLFLLHYNNNNNKKKPLFCGANLQHELVFLSKQRDRSKDQFEELEIEVGPL